MSGHQNDRKNLTVLVIFFVANWKIHHFLDRSIIMCESSINGPLSIAMLNSQRVGLRQSIYVSFRRILLTGMLGFGCMNHQQLGIKPLKCIHVVGKLLVAPCTHSSLALS